VVEDDHQTTMEEEAGAVAVAEVDPVEVEEVEINIREVHPQHQ